MAAPARKRKWDVGAPEEPIAQKAKVDQSPAIHLDAKDLAELAAAKMNALLSSQKAGSSTSGSSTPTVAAAAAAGTFAVKPVVPGTKPTDFVKDIEINDLKNRYLLTKGSTQTDIKKETGCDIVTRGKYYSDKTLATSQEPPLYLHITAATEEILEKAVKMVEELIAQASLPVAPDRSQAGGYNHPPRQQFTEKVFLGFESDRPYNTRGKIVGPGGQFVKHIQQETGTKVFLKGKGSGYDYQNNTEGADEPLHLFISGWNEDAVKKAVDLCEDLVKTVRDDYEEQKKKAAAPPPPPAPAAYNPYAAYGYAGYPGYESYGAQPTAATGAEGYSQEAYQQWAAAYAGYDWSQYQQYQQPTSDQYQQPPPPTQPAETEKKE
ncbi:hypothetical protein HDV05_005933 [Chytridiales sp. JEL 0842]|nr:hypothetical protein HDV05_005933 [Chytridiales sp. JEL 0842]